MSRAKAGTGPMHLVPPGSGVVDENWGLRLESALEWARSRLAGARREDYASERVFKRVVTVRRNAVRRVERMLMELGRQVVR